MLRVRASTGRAGFRKIVTGTGGYGPQMLGPCRALPTITYTEYMEEEKINENEKDGYVY